MKVFKTYFKIVKKNIIPLLIYFFVFIFISVLLVGQQVSKNDIVSFSDKKINIAIFNYDTDSEFSNDFAEFLSKKTNLIEIEDDKETLQDALFFRKIVYIVKIPEGFAKKMMNSDPNAKIEKTTVAGATNTIYMDFLIEKYINAAKLYLDNVPNISNDKLSKYLEEEMQIEADVNVYNFNKKVENDRSTYYFIYFAYVALAIIISGVTEILIVFNSVEIRKRNLVSKLKLSSYNFQIILASIVFVMILTVLLCLLSILFYGEEVLNKNFILLSLNAFIFSFVVLSISFLLGNIMKSKEVISAVTNILSLGLCFISGIFVPQEYMDVSVLKIASFTPTYWYVNTVKSIQSMTTWTNENILKITYNMLIQLGFVVAIFAIALVIIRQNRSSKEL